MEIEVITTSLEEDIKIFCDMKGIKYTYTRYPNKNIFRFRSGEDSELISKRFKKSLRKERKLIEEDE